MNGVHDAVDKLKGHLLMEDVAHGADEDIVRLFPLQRLFEVFLVQSQSEAIALFLQPHGLKAPRHHLGIAMRTTRRPLGTSRDGIPRLVGPFYFGGF